MKIRNFCRVLAETQNTTMGSLTRVRSFSELSVITCVEDEQLPSLVLLTDSAKLGNEVDLTDIEEDSNAPQKLLIRCSVRTNEDGKVEGSSVSNTELDDAMGALVFPLSLIDMVFVPIINEQNNTLMIKVEGKARDPNHCGCQIQGGLVLDKLVGYLVRYEHMGFEQKIREAIVLGLDEAISELVFNAVKSGQWSHMINRGFDAKTVAKALVDPSPFAYCRRLLPRCDFTKSSDDSSLVRFKVQGRSFFVNKGVLRIHNDTKFGEEMMASITST
uniref:DUF7754 domain-containing protein n=1 Tax=Ditylenchus dipsaci TaxID=166011 RepID=A0A915EV28_9BILA